jgi:hypothetical protein
MSTQALPRSPSLHWLRRLACGVLSGLSLFAAACDPFLVSVCQFEDRPGCHSADPAKPDAGQPPREPGSPAPLGPLRRFELRASVPLGNSLRFVGLQGSPRQAVFLAIDGSMNKRWDVASLDLNNSELTARVRVGGTCSIPTCPMIPAGMDFALDRIYRTGAGFYYFDYKLQKKVTSWAATIPLNGITLANYRLRPFMSSQGDSMMTIGNELGLTHVLFSSTIIGQINKPGRNVVSVVIGDLDKFDSQVTDLEAITFDDEEAFGLARSSGLEDSALKKAINIAVQMHSGGASGSVQAAYIHDINNDSLSDFLFVRGGRFRVVSYRGKDKQGFPYEFGGWADDVAPAISGETVQYVAIDELTQDSYQDLIVETDKNVHFYRNVAM